MRSIGLASLALACALPSARSARAEAVAAADDPAAAETPTVRHTPVAEQLQLHPVPIYVELQPDDAVSSMALFYRPAGDDDFERVTLHRYGLGYYGEIPCRLMQQRAWEYYVEASDAAGAVLARAGSRDQPFRVSMVDELSPGAPYPLRPDGRLIPDCVEDDGDMDGLRELSVCRPCLDDIECETAESCAVGCCSLAPAGPRNVPQDSGRWPAASGARLDLTAGLVTHIGDLYHAGFAGAAPAVGGGVELQALVWTGSVYAIGLHFGQLWLRPSPDRYLREVEQRDFLLMNVFNVCSWPDAALAIDLGLGATWYLGRPVSRGEGYEPSDSHWVGESLSPVLHAGVETAIRLHEYVFLAAGVRFAVSIPLSCMAYDSSHCYAPDWLGLNLHGGLTVPLP